MPRARKPFLRVTVALMFVMFGALVASFGDIHDDQQRLTVILPAVAGAALVLIAGMVAVKITARAVREAAGARIGEVQGNGLARAVGFAGTILIVLSTLSALRVGIQALLLGGALTGVVLGIAAQQSLGNVFAGIMLLVAKPFNAGEDTVIKSTLGEYEGRVTNVGFLYVTMLTKNGRVEIPNAVALASAVGPGARTVAVQEEEFQGEDPAGPS